MAALPAQKPHPKGQQNSALKAVMEGRWKQPSRGPKAQATVQMQGGVRLAAQDQAPLLRSGKLGSLCCVHRHGSTHPGGRERGGGLGRWC